MEPLVIIPARGNSKGLPGKNIKPLAGRPLILYTLAAAKELFPPERICVSTDSSEIADVVASAGYKVPFIRPTQLATDTASTRDVILHAIEYYRERGTSVSDIVLLQPTSPLRDAEHIRNAIALYESNDCDMVVSVKEASASPYFTLFEEDELGWLKKSKPFAASRRQDVPPVWEYNGAIYIFSADLIFERELSEFDRIMKFVMDEYSSVDIDSELDWVVAEYIAKNKKD